MRNLRPLFLLLTAATLSSCVYTNIKVPRGYRTATPAEVKSAPDDPAVTGKSCMRTVLFLVAWGDSSYAASLQEALGKRDGILYDVRADVKINSYLFGLYSRVCTVLSGKVAKP